LIRFSLTLAIVTVIILVAGLSGQWKLPSFFYQSLILLVTGTGGLFYFLLRTRDTRPDYFVQLYLLTIAVKLLAYGAFLGLVIWTDREGAAHNVVFFMVVYAVFTALEVGFLLRRVSKD
jgi:hypothetical protein